jgi:hypothetical protein
LGLPKSTQDILKDEHPTWRSLCTSKQLGRLRCGSDIITSTSGLSRAFVGDNAAASPLELVGNGKVEQMEEGATGWEFTAASCCPMTLMLLPGAVSISLTSVEAERGFSLMKLILTRLRSSLKEKQLDNLMTVASLAPPASCKE